jgi:hypothetical protein
MNKPGIDVVIGLGKAKPPKPPMGMMGPKPPMEMEMESEEQQNTEDSRMAKIESKLDRICEALGLHDEDESDETAEVSEEDGGYE